MQKNKNKKIKTGLLIFASLAFGWALSAGSASAAPGLSIDCQVINTTSYIEWHGESTDKWTGNLDFYGSNNLDTKCTGRVKISNRYEAQLRAKGAINLSKGTYKFRINTNYEHSGYGGSEISISDKNGNLVCDPSTSGIPHCGDSVPIAIAGWYQINVFYEAPDWYWAPQISLEWTTPTNSSWTVVPVASLDSSNWADESTATISIPSFGKQQIDYKVAGVGTDTVLTTGKAKLEIQLPDGITAGDILSDGVQLFWRDGTSAALRVKNTVTGTVANLTGVRLETAKGIQLEGLTAKLPSTFFAGSEADQKIQLSFENLDADLDGGIAMVVVYKDLTKPNGVLKIRALGEEVYRSASHAVSFDVSTMDPTTLRPFFLLEDGMSKASPASEARHNYMAMKASASQPGEAELFMKGITTANGEISNPALKRIIPRVNPSPLAGPNPAGPVDKWYPEYGREGAEIDVLSTAGNYAPNLLYSGYVTGGSDGIFDPSFQIPSGNNWVSFQYASSDFYGDGSAELGSNESSFFFATGLLYYDAAKLLVCPSSKSLSIGEKQQFTAYYWDSKFGDLPGCSEAEADITVKDVTYDTALSWTKGAPDNELKFIATGKVEAVVATDTYVRATYKGITSDAKVTVAANSCISYPCVENSCTVYTGTNNDCPATSGNCTYESQNAKCNSGGNTNVLWEEVAP